MIKNHFSPLEDLPDEDKIKKLVSNLEYKRIETSQLPEPLINNGLAGKCNSFIAAASGTDECMLYSFVGIRPDKGEVFDEHPIVLCYNQKDASKNFGGVIHHGDWPDRTMPFEKWQMDAMAASGVTASFEYKSIPPGSSGSLVDLRTNGMLDGLSKQFEILIKNKRK